ncbi:hypothetical protein PGTUg99_008701 [Puccinia graminis f. sp. tritici]|uniref:Uncharacterized protein n=1 Tax=Puccinia graminis f. sp. tritici TaxID=56615 RepID=A0A5B0REK5_PUCGR|nr:hypothetical protein PGTUg99_008701 [Puccinia graminis f. sp. tritici]
MCGRQLYEDRHFSMYMTEQEMRKVLLIKETPKLNLKRCPGVQDSSNAKDENYANSVPVDPTAKRGRPQVPRRRSSSAQLKMITNTGISYTSRSPSRSPTDHQNL